jgi:cold shock protein
MQGTVERFHNGFGWIHVDGDDKQSYFVHWSDIDMDGFKSLAAGDQVEFRIEKTDRGRGYKAVEVRRIV